RLRSRVRSFSQISGHLHTTRAQSTAAERTSEAGGGPTMDMVRTIRPQLGPASATARASWLVTSPTEGIVFGTAVSVGKPASAPTVRAQQRQTRARWVRTIGSARKSPVNPPRTTTTPTPDINATVQQMARRTAAGCDTVRVAFPTADDAAALPI